MAKPYREVPSPLEGNDQQIAAIGTAAWAVALIVLFALRDHLPRGSHWWIWTCAAGVGIGLFAMVYIPYLHRSRARAGRRRSDSSPDGDSSPGTESSPGSGSSSGE